MTSSTRLVRILIYITAIGMLAFSPLSAQTAKPAMPMSRILVIHSYHPSFEWTRELHEGLVQTLDNWSGDFSLSVEYMDAKRIFSSAHINGLATLYQAKYHKAPPDLVICSDNDAFTLLYNRRTEIFGQEVPVVFCGVNYFNRGDWPFISNFVGVDERPDLEHTVELIDQFHPAHGPVVFISDSSTTGKAYRKGYLKWVGTRKDPARFTLIDDDTPEGIIRYLGRLPENAVLVYHTYVEDSHGSYYEPEYLLHRIVETYDFPVYGNYSWMIGEGIIGGPLIDSFEQGVMAARLAIETIDGTIDPAVFRLISNPSRMAFDYPYMRKAGISIGELPRESKVYNQPDFFWREFPIETTLVSVILLILVGGLVFADSLYRQRGELLAEAGETNRRLKLNENRLETLDTLAHLDNQDDREIVATLLQEATNITSSEYAVAVIRENRSATVTEIVVDRQGGAAEAEMNESDGNIRSTAPWLQEFRSRHPVQYNQEIGPFSIGSASLNIRRGILVPCGDLNMEGEGFSLVTGVFNKAVPYDDADTRQLTLLSYGCWRILSRNRSEKEMRALNQSLESRVIERSEELRKAEAQLLRSEKMATLGSLVAGLAHEVNTPLGLAVTGGSYIRDMADNTLSHYREDTLDAQTLEAFLSASVEIGNSLMANLQRAVDLMQTFKQVAVDRTGETPREFNFGEYIQETLMTLRIPLREANVSVDVDCSESIRLNHFPGDMGRVFTNLILNSIKHGFKGRDQGKIFISVCQDDGSLYILYSDDGKGIPENVLGKIFDPFYTTARGSGGTGLGLHLVRSIICDRHGGTIDVESKPEEGVRFSFCLPEISPALKEFVL